ncbi:MAG: glycosyltransferase family 2 protein, partial [Candidatus Omnitrophica bacterium]|nr:glycosyltransferase family 2 protein [Candidatus Omnitrophota bacterium]
MRLAVVIPAHNEGQTIGPLVKAVKALGHDCIVINDGSADQTRAMALEAGAVVLDTPVKSGKGNALKMGFDYVKTKGYELLVTMDGDGQHAPSDIPALEVCYKAKGADIVNGNRMANPTGMPWLRLFTNHLMSSLISLICRQHIPDTQCGFRLLKTKVLEAVHLRSSDFEIETEVLIKASKKGFKIASVGIQTIYSNEISKIQPMRDTG